ncbi:MAG: PilZ domain-containing protein [Eubacteriales bacterium]|nr:PilZ domain-containing protein [Eubacteriales bacterium]
MRLTGLLENQRLTIQLLWGEQKIEFFSNVIEKDDSVVYVSPYLHNGSELDLNVVQGKGVICNIFTNDPSTKHRISWKNIELTTVIRNDKMVYCLRTNGYNHIAKHDDRRMHDRLIVQVKAKVFDGQSNEGVDIIVYDISDIGISFYAPKNFIPNTRQLKIFFSEIIDEKKFDVNVECTIARTTNKAGNQFVGCRITKENKDYQLYGFMKRLGAKNKNRISISKPKDDDLSENS